MQKAATWGVDGNIDNKITAYIARNCGGVSGGSGGETPGIGLR